MKTTLLITTFNRPQYLKRCLASVKRAGITDVLIVDDCSNNPETKQLVAFGGYPSIFKNERKGICDSILMGVDFLFDHGYDIVINLDADAIIRNDYLDRMLELHAAFPNDIITGFHSTTKNADGSERHRILGVNRAVEKFGNARRNNVPFLLKESVGGINMLWTKQTWTQMKPVIENAQKHRLNWDHEVSKAAGGIICAYPSLVEHIGIESAMGHTGIPDVAEGFKTLSLPNVTLVCVDDNAIRATEAVRKCAKDIDFGDIKILSHEPFVDKDFGCCWYPIPKLGSKEQYSKFILHSLHYHIKTDFALIVQHDGYVKNPEAWLPEFTNYDYIGATWWYTDGMNVGNGGFSLRSRKLLQLSANLPTPKMHPEDETICRDCRLYLEYQGVRFAPDNIANKFSFEGYNQPGSWNGQFGFHGHRALRTPPNPKMMGFIVNQYLGLGDILYLVPLIRHWMQQGHDVIWPIADEYFSIAHHFPDIQFCKKSDWPRVPYELPHETMHRWAYGMYQVKPLRWNRSRKYEEAMTTKYSMYGLNPEMWRELRWERDYEREKKLAAIIGAVGDYELIFEDGGNITDGGAFKKKIGTSGLPRVYSQRIDGFTLLDWSGIIEGAKEIHAVSSSCIYLFEVLNLRAESVHLYSRRAGQRDFDMVKPVLSKNYIFHV